FWNACLTAASICFWTSLSETLRFCFLVSCSIQLPRIRNSRTWLRSWLYSCWHWPLSCASVGSGWPLAGLPAVAFFWALHVVNDGASGRCALGDAPVVTGSPTTDTDAICIQ